ncbi:hypothetical protein SAMN05444714_1591 [Yoonia litorea]|uniref:Uncharacterized protein n=1 Tax=Yoonia litorea TaxID=1123755 RepID=A0A1I6MDC9_9RHOB|nr:hypothetical protein SAMN05444714_1591 [Yoonia litorea]
MCFAQISSLPLTCGKKKRSKFAIPLTIRISSSARIAPDDPTQCDLCPAKTAPPLIPSLSHTKSAAYDVHAKRRAECTSALLSGLFIPRHPAVAPATSTERVHPDLVVIDQHLGARTLVGCQPWRDFLQRDQRIRVAPYC